MKLWDEEDRKRERRIARVKTTARAVGKWCLMVGCGVLVAFGVIKGTDYLREKQLAEAQAEADQKILIGVPPANASLMDRNGSPMPLDEYAVTASRGAYLEEVLLDDLAQIRCYSVHSVEYDPETGQMAVWLEKTEDGSITVNPETTIFSVATTVQGKTLFGVPLEDDDMTWDWLRGPVRELIERSLAENLDLFEVLKRTFEDEDDERFAYLGPEGNLLGDPYLTHQWQDDLGHYHFGIIYLGTLRGYYSYIDRAEKG